MKKGKKNIKIEFRTKEESNRIQQEEFLKLPPGERFLVFLRNMQNSKVLPKKEESEKSNNNFIIVIDSDKVKSNTKE